MISEGQRPLGELDREIAKMAVQLESALIRLERIERRHLDDIPGAMAVIRSNITDAVNERLAFIERQVAENRTIQSRMMWMVAIAFAAQLFRVVGPDVISHVIK